MAKALFEIDNLAVCVEEKEVLKNLSLKIFPGEIHALMGRNGSGKTTLAKALMGHPRYEITQGSVRLDGEDITAMSADERAKRRLFLGFQYPVAIPGVTVANFLRASVKAVRHDEVPTKEFRKRVREELKNLQIPESFMTRHLNDGFSGGEQKRLEMLQMRLLQPKVAVLDETDSGLDIDALKTVAQNIQNTQDGTRGFLLITHYQRILDYVAPDHVHILMDGGIVRSGGPELAQSLEETGYEGLLEQHA